MFSHLIYIFFRTHSFVQMHTQTILGRLTPNAPFFFLWAPGAGAMVCLQIHQPQIMEDIVEFVFFVPQTLEKFGEAIELMPQATSLRGADCGRPGQLVPQIVGKSLSPVPHITEDTEEVIVAIPVPVFMEDSLEQIVTIPAPQFAEDTVKVTSGWRLPRA